MQTGLHLTDCNDGGCDDHYEDEHRYVVESTLPSSIRGTKAH